MAVIRGIRERLRALFSRREVEADMEEELDWDVGYRRTGNLMVARTDEQMDYLRKTTESETAAGLGVELISPDETRRLDPFIPEDLEILGGKYCPSDGIRSRRIR